MVDAYLAAWRHIDKTSGHAFNIGGGAGNTTSLLELLAAISLLTGERPDVRLAPWRDGDQRFYVSDIAKFQAATGWAPAVGVTEGVARLHAWLLATRRTSRAHVPVATPVASPEPVAPALQ